MNLTKRGTVLEAESAARREKLNLPPKNSRNSITPPSRRCAVIGSNCRRSARRDAGYVQPRSLSMLCASFSKPSRRAGLETGSPFGQNLQVFVLYLRCTRAISFEVWHG